VSLHFVLASLHAVLASARVAVAFPPLVLAFLQVVAPLRHVAMVFRTSLQRRWTWFCHQCRLIRRSRGWWRRSGSGGGPGYGIARCSKWIASRSKRFGENLSPVD
jgi:hypothetical protein